ncbi:CoA transferase [Schaalia sp. ZJ405]|uniref:CaiB/BaiF CoA transferase family protein n=1 Tax=Schaalia sp. ZJ405 TaxID=2709403 RepID=UPI0013EBF6D0|nr:CoA transferase [Schaalia sp. ZJ405]QPK80925.1 CoA transferase [Schaalia sp. ZJ405]
MTVSRHQEEGPLHGLTVIDASTLFAGPMAAMHLGDMGARVIKVEHPRKPDPSRGHGAAKNGINLWWKTLGRNKECMTINLNSLEGREIMLRLVEKADVLIENFRPDTLERWNLAPDTLREVNPGLVVARVTGFGQIGPYRRRPGFGTLAESMSGFAAMTGEAHGSPTLPPFGLADGIASLAVAYAVMVALRHRDVTGRGGDIDMAIIEPILAMLGPQITRWDQLREVQPRTGNRSTNNAPRNIYPTADDQWVAVSTSAQSIAERVLTLVGHPEVIDEPWFATGKGRAEHADLLDQYVGQWISQRTQSDVIEAFTRAQAAIAPIYDAEDIVGDPQFNALGTIHTINDPDFGEMAMQGPLFRFSNAPATIAFTGRPHGCDTSALLDELGYSVEEEDAFRRAEIIK